MVWSNLIWYDMTLYDLIWSDLIWSDLPCVLPCYDPHNATGFGVPHSGASGRLYRSRRTALDTRPHTQTTVELGCRRGRGGIYRHTDHFRSPSHFSRPLGAETPLIFCISTISCMFTLAGCDLSDTGLAHILNLAADAAEAGSVRTQIIWNPTVSWSTSHNLLLKWSMLSSFVGWEVYDTARFRVRSVRYGSCMI